MTLRPDIATELDSFFEAWNARSFPHYRVWDKIITSDAAKFPIAHLLDEVQKPLHALTNEGKKLVSAVWGYWRERIFFEQHSERHDIEAGHLTEVISTREGIK